MTQYERKKIADARHAFAEAIIAARSLKRTSLFPGRIQRCKIEPLRSNLYYEVQYANKFDVERRGADAYWFPMYRFWFEVKRGTRQTLYYSH